MGKAWSAIKTNGKMRYSWKKGFVKYLVGSKRCDIL